MLTPPIVTNQPLTQNFLDRLEKSEREKGLHSLKSEGWEIESIAPRLDGDEKIVTFVHTQKVPCPDRCQSAACYPIAGALLLAGAACTCMTAEATAGCCPKFSEKTRQVETTCLGHFNWLTGIACKGEARCEQKALMNQTEINAFENPQHRNRFGVSTPTRLVRRDSDYEGRRSTSPYQTF